MGTPIPFIVQSPLGIARAIALRMKARRLKLGWSRKLLGSRAGVSQWTLKKFESSGKIALESLIRLAIVLDDARGLEGLFNPHPELPGSIAELEKSYSKTRLRGRTLV